MKINKNLLREMEIFEERDLVYMKIDTKVLQTPVMKQYYEIKSKNHDAIILFRMGDFYETFDEDALITSDILGIVLTKRSNGKASDVDLAGFPYHSLDNYLPKLVNAGYKVAICEQVENAKSVKGIVKREVVEIITPGTIFTDNISKQSKNNYIGCLHFSKEKVGLALIDISTGQFFMGESTHSDLSNVLLKFSPSEIVISKSIIYSSKKWFLKVDTEGVGLSGEICSELCACWPERCAKCWDAGPVRETLMWLRVSWGSRPG